MDCGFKVTIAGVSICFSDREAEVETVKEWLERPQSFPIAVYGPEGCGKTTLFKYFAWRMRKRGYLSLYVNALGARDLAEVVDFDKPGILKEILDSLVAEFRLPLGLLVSRLITHIVYRLYRSLAASKGIIVVLDDVYKAIGLEEVDRYTKMLYEWISWKLPELNIKEFLVILTTSEGVSKRELLKHTYVRVYMLWNLPRNGFYELVEQLNPPLDPELIWRISGGNPRVVAELASLGWNLDKLIEEYRERVSKLLTAHSIPLDTVKRLAKDPDSNPENALRLEEIGLMIQVMKKMVLGRSVEEDPELGIGREWAWQIPLYRYVVLGENPASRG